MNQETEKDGNRLHDNRDDTDIPRNVEAKFGLGPKFVVHNFFFKMIGKVTFGALSKGAILFPNPPLIEALPVDPC